MRPDPTPPQSLHDLQQEMGAAITIPYEWDSNGEYGPTPEKYPARLLSRITEHNGIPARDRLRVYNSGYWNRLFTILQDELPLLVHLMGVDEFNRFASHYLQAFPSASPILNNLCDGLPEFMTMDHDWNTDLLREAADLEYRYIKAFDAAQLPPLDPEKLSATEAEGLADRPLYIQPHTTLFDEQWNMVESRKIARSTDDDTLILKPESKHQHWLLYRSLGNAITPFPISTLQRDLLSALYRGDTFSDAIEAACANLPSDELTLVTENLPGWFAEWTSFGIFSLEESG